MAYDRNDWNPLQAKLRDLITKKESFDEMKELLLRMHSMLHCREVYGGAEQTYMDELWEELGDSAFRTMPTIKDDINSFSNVISDPMCYNIKCFFVKKTSIANNRGWVNDYEFQRMLSVRSDNHDRRSIRDTFEE